MIKLFKPQIGNEELGKVKEVLKSGTWSNGPRVQEFEERFAEYIGVPHAVTVNNGSSALYLALRLFDIEGCDVLVPSLTFVSTVHAIVLNNATPVFVDINEDTLLIDIEDLKEKITDKARLILPVHLMGHPCDIRAIKEIASDRDIGVVDDCAQAAGATYDGKKVGSHFLAGCFSLYPTKPLASIQGGVICINSPHALLKKRKVESLRFCGITGRRGFRYDVDSLAYNMYWDDVCAAIALEQLKKLDGMNEKRRRIARFYNSKLKDVEWIETLPYNPDSTYHLYVVRVKKGRDAFIEHMAECGVECGIHYAKGVHQLSFYKKYASKCPNTEKATDEIVTLPCYPGLATKDLDHILGAIKSFK